MDELTSTSTWPADWTVRRARDAYLAENGFTVASYDDAWTDATIFGIPVKVPNTPKHRAAIMFHDLHHVATGFGTDHVGEAEISAWEIRRGRAPLGFYVASIVAMGTLLGLVMAPRRTLAAWRASKAPPLWAQGAPYEDLLDMTVGDLRAKLGVPKGGVAQEPRRLHARAPA